MGKDVTKVIHIAPATSDALTELDQLIGERRAFSRVADSCSAADADTLRRIRNEKLYVAKGITWEEFCPRFLNISKPEANRIIRRFDEFGHAYFDVSRMVRISPESYRAIAPAVKDNAIEFEGERIPLVPENSQRVHAAVQALRVAAGTAKPKRQKAKELKEPEKPAPAAGPNPNRVNEIELQVTGLVRELFEICRASRSGRDRERIRSLAHHLKFRICDLEVEAA